MILKNRHQHSVLRFYGGELQREAARPIENCLGLVTSPQESVSAAVKCTASNLVNHERRFGTANQFSAVVAPVIVVSAYECAKLNNCETNQKLSSVIVSLDGVNQQLTGLT